VPGDDLLIFCFYLNRRSPKRASVKGQVKVTGRFAAYGTPFGQSNCPGLDLDQSVANFQGIFGYALKKFVTAPKRWGHSDLMGVVAALTQGSDRAAHHTLGRSDPDQDHFPGQCSFALLLLANTFRPYCSPPASSSFLTPCSVSW
jgi:hypothetical protein